MGRRISVKALIVGVSVDLVGSLVLALVTAVGLTVALAIQGYSRDEITSKVPLLHEKTAFLVGTLILALAIAFLAGIVAGRIAKGREILHGALVGGLILMEGPLFDLFMDDPTPLWSTILAYFLTPLAATLGGLVARASQPRPGAP